MCWLTLGRLAPSKPSSSFRALSSRCLPARSTSRICPVSWLSLGPNIRILSLSRWAAFSLNHLRRRLWENPPPPSSSRHQRLSILSATLCNLAPSSKFLRCMTSPLPQIMTMTTHRALALAQVVMTSRRSTHTTLRFNLGHVCTVMPGGHLSTRGHRGRRCQPPSSVPPGHMLS
jgi:hypothetical protein